ncbi:MAG TPA: biotin transporter BioY [Bacillota bacterium]|nr:biotin transporter BioY [Bacillota bacterium]
MRNWSTGNKKTIGIQGITLIPLFTALITVGAYVRIPTPLVPITFQVFFVVLAGLLLGPRFGAYSALLYLLLGLFGVPVFTEGGGFGYIFRPTFGYIIGFFFGAYATGKIAWSAVPNPKASFQRLLLAVGIGVLIIYIIGAAYFYVISNYVIHIPIGVGALFLYCFAMVIPGDAITGVLAAILAKRLMPVIGKAREG